MSSATKLLVVRHGHVEGIEPHRFRGRQDLPLTAKGIAQAEATSRRIATSWKPSAVYASPLSRAVVTAEAIARPFGLPVHRLEDLIDMDYGRWTGLIDDEVRAEWPEEIDTWYRAPHLAEIPRGETLQAVLTRVARALNHIVRLHAGETAIVVGHDSVNRVILTHALDLPLANYRHFKIDPCGISEVDFADDCFTIRRVNEAGHLQ